MPNLIHSRWSATFAFATMLATVAYSPLVAAAPIRTFDYVVLVTATHGSATIMFPGLVGTMIDGSYSYDKNTPDGNPSPTDGLYIDILGSMSITVDGTTFGGGVGGSIKLNIGSDPCCNNLYRVSNGNGTIVFSLIGLPGTITSDALPQDAPDVADFTINNEFFLDLGGPEVEPGFSNVVVGTVIAITRVVPEPATLALLGIGLAGLGFSRRRKR